MELLVSFAFGAAVGILSGYLFGGRRTPTAPASRAGAGPARAAPPPAPPPAAHGPAAPSAVRRVALDDGSANVLNALNNRLSAIGTLADLLHGSPLDPERARALMMLHGEVRRAAEITQHFLELVEHPVGAAEPSDLSVVINGVLAERDATLRELNVRVTRGIPDALSMVACPMAQLTEMLTKLLDFSLRRLRETTGHRELRIAVTETGPSHVVALWDSGAPLAVEAEQRLVTPFRFTQGGGGEIEFALARALAQSSGGTLRLRPRGGGGAEVVVTLPRSVLGMPTGASREVPSLPRMRILVVDDDSVNRQAMELLLKREGHEVVAVENGLEAIERLEPRARPFDVIITDLQMPRLGGRALYEQLVEQRPEVAHRFVFVTGDQARAETRQFLEECGQPSVLKPYDLSDLIKAVGEIAPKNPDRKEER